MNVLVDIGGFGIKIAAYSNGVIERLKPRRSWMQSYHYAKYAGRIQNGLYLILKIQAKYDQSAKKAFWKKRHISI